MSRNGFPMDKYEYFNSRDFAANLPTEILIAIFRHLTSYSDKLEASLVCRRWFETVQCLLEKRIIFQKSSLLADSVEPVSTFLKSCQSSYRAITVDNTEIGDCKQFWQLFHNQITELEIIDPEIKRRQFVDTVQYLKSLRSLKLVNCRDLFMSNKIFSSDHDQEVLRASLRGLKHLGIVDNRYLSDAFFSRLTILMPELESLDLTACQISFHKGLYKKFYPNSGFQKGASESILTFHYVHEFISNNAVTIKELNFSKTLIDGDALEKLTEIEELNLHKVSLASCDQLTNTGLIALATSQTELAHLDLSSCVRVTDQSVVCFSQHLPGLRVLRLKLCRAITDLGITELANLKQLEELDVSGCEYVTGAGIEKLFKEQPNTTLQRIHLGALSNIHESTVIKLVEMCPNLTVLNLSSSRSGITNKSAQAIFIHAVRLRELILDFCDNLTDAGLLGMELNEEDARESSPSSTGSSTQSAGRTISLRSRAEQEIVNDAILKNNMQTMCEAQEGNINLSKSIANIKGLQVLRLTGCNKVTDVSLIYCFKFLELHSLTFAKCHQISTVGIQDLVRNCPSIQVLNLSECQSIDDKAIRHITTYVRRLKELYIDRCYKVSDHSLDAISLNCKYLKVLDVRGCRGMCPEPGLRLQTVKTLRHLMTSKPGPYGDPSTAYFPQAPPFRLV